MHTLTLQIPDAQFPYIISELNKFKDIKIDYHTEYNTKNEIKEDIRQAVKEVILVKQGKLKARPARELLNEL